MNTENIVLIGMPGAGKSTLGVVLAKVLGYDFIDSDIEIQHATGLTLPHLIERFGREGFLDIESDVNTALAPERRSVIATGGSVIYRERAMMHLRSIGRVVYLRVPCVELERRIHTLEARGVAMGEGMTLRDLFAERAPLYERYAHVILDEQEGMGDNLRALAELFGDAGDE